MDIDLGGGAQDSSGRISLGGRACQGAPLKKKEKQEMSLFELFVTDGSERTDEKAKDDAMLDGEEMAQTRGIAVLS